MHYKFLLCFIFTLTQIKGMETTELKALDLSDPDEAYAYHVTTIQKIRTIAKETTKECQQKNRNFASHCVGSVEESHINSRFDKTEQGFYLILNGVGVLLGTPLGRAHIYPMASCDFPHDMELIEEFTKHFTLKPLCWIITDPAKKLKIEDIQFNFSVNQSKNLNEKPYYKMSFKDICQRQDIRFCRPAHSLCSYIYEIQAIDEQATPQLKVASGPISLFLSPNHQFVEHF